MITQRPADYEAWAAYLAARGISRPLQADRLLLVQISHGRAWAFFDSLERPPLALGGIVHASVRSEAWFAATPAAAEHMLALVRKFRRQLDQDQRLATGALVTRTSADNPEGQRLARMLGFRPAEIEPGRIILWRRADGISGQTGAESDAGHRVGVGVEPE